MKETWLFTVLLAALTSFVFIGFFCHCPSNLHAQTQPEVTVESWESLLGKVEISFSSRNVVGKLVHPNPGINLKKGTRVLEGVLLEDCLSGKFRLDATGCKREVWGFGVLLLGDGGTVLSGSIHVDTKGCKIQGLTGPKSLYWTRVLPVVSSTKTSSGIVSKQNKRNVSAETKSSKKKPVTHKKALETVENSSETEAKHKHRLPVLSGPKAEPGTYDPRKALGAKARLMKMEGEALLDAGRFEKARKKFEFALIESPCDPFALNGIGVTYVRRNMYDEALIYYKKALTCDPEYMDVYYNIGCVYAIQNKLPLAIRYLKISLMNGFTNMTIMSDDPDLVSLHANPDFQALLRGEF